MWVSITFIIYGTESDLMPLTLKLLMTMGMYTEHPSVGMLSPFQPIGICMEPLRHTGIQSMLTEHLRPNK